MENLEREYFVSFPKCEKVADLQPHSAQWVQLKNKYGVGLPNDRLIAMFWKILPDEVREDVKKQKDIKRNLDLQIGYLYGEIADSMDDKLSRWNLSKLQQQLKFRTKNSTGLNAVGASVASEPKPSSPDEVPPPPMPDMANFQANLERMVNAAVSRGRNTQRTPPASRSGSEGSRPGRGRIPNPKFKGCWCCGEEGHTRQNCSKFLSIKKANGGKVPKDYEGAYEKFMKKGGGQSTKVIAPVAIFDSSSEEFEVKRLRCRYGRCCQCPVVHLLSNRRLIATGQALIASVRLGSL